jgi:predicted Zn-dependent protease
MKTTSLVLAATLLAVPLMAQGGKPAATAASAPQPADLNQVVQEATKLANAGDTAGAIKKLEDLRKGGAAMPAPVLSLLGGLYLRAKRPQDALNVLKPLADAETADPAVLYNAGLACRALGQQEAWLGYLARAASRAPGSPATRDLGMVYMRTGRVVEAYSLLRPWSLANPHDAEARLAAASLAVQLERPREAEELALTLAQNDIAIKLLRGRIQALKGDGPGALALLEPLVAKHPASMDLELRRALAEAYLAANRPADAVKILDGKTANHPTLVLLLGRAQHRAGQSQAAFATLKPFVDKLPADPSAIGDPRPAAGIAVEYGALLIDANRAGEAVPLLDKATRLYVNSPEAWQTLARAYDATNRKDEAAKARAQAQQIKLAAARPIAQTPPAPPPAAQPAAPPPSARPAPAAGGAPVPAGPVMSQDMKDAIRFISEGRADDALAAVRRELTRAPGNPQARNLEIVLLLRVNRADEALRITEEQLRRQPNNPDLVYQHGAIQMARKSLVAAEKDLRHALELAPNHLGALNDLAVLLKSQGKTAEARALLEKALRIDPGNPNAAANLKALQEGKPQ